MILYVFFTIGDDTFDVMILYLISKFTIVCDNTHLHMQVAPDGGHTHTPTHARARAHTQTHAQ